MQLKPEIIVQKINAQLLLSEAVDGDLKKCRVKTIARLTASESAACGSNWTVGTVSSDCRDECLSELLKMVASMRQDYQADWK
jgi:hypothetical protein